MLGDSSLGLLSLISQSRLIDLMDCQFAICATPSYTHENGLDPYILGIGKLVGRINDSKVVDKKPRVGTKDFARKVLQGLICVIILLLVCCEDVCLFIIFRFLSLIAPWIKLAEAQPFPLPCVADPPPKHYRPTVAGCTGAQ